MDSSNFAIIFQSPSRMTVSNALVSHVLYGRPRECHNKITQSFLITQRKRNCFKLKQQKFEYSIAEKPIEPRCEKTGLRGFRPGPTQTRLYSYRRWLEAGNFVYWKKRNCTIYVAKTKALISFAVICKKPVFSRRGSIISYPTKVINLLKVTFEW